METMRVGRCNVVRVRETTRWRRDGDDSRATGGCDANCDDATTRTTRLTRDARDRRSRVFSRRAQSGERRSLAEAEALGVRVRDWEEKEVRDASRASSVEGPYRRRASASGAFGSLTASANGRVGGSPVRADVRQSVHKVARQKGVSSGRTYTSKYRGVHQTFPTGRWEAQFRRNGKPTSLGCFDREEEAAKAYDRMMLWCELHASLLATTASPQKQGAAALNFDVSTYASELHTLERLSQDDLMQELRRLGRSQASGQRNVASIFT